MINWMGVILIPQAEGGAAATLLELTSGFGFWYKEQDA